MFFSSSLTISIKTLLILFCYTHQRVLHVAFSLCNKLNTVHKEIFKQVFQMFADILLIIMLEASEAIEMKQDNLNVAQAVGLITMPDLLVFNHIFFLSQRKFLAKIIGHTINLCNFILWIIMVIVLMLYFSSINLILLPLYSYNSSLKILQA